jgi:hypothetical protein
MTHKFFFFNNSKLGSITSVKSIASAHSPDSFLENIMNVPKYILLTAEEQLENSFDVCLNKVACFGHMGNVEWIRKCCLQSDN